MTIVRAVMMSAVVAAGAHADERPLFVDVTEQALPFPDLTGPSMDARPVDVDGDGDLDILIASEFRPNILLVNDGAGRFVNESDTRIPRLRHDSEDIAVADFDRDGDVDVVIVSEDDQVNELYLNDGHGRFADGSAMLPVAGVSNAVAAADLDQDGDVDIVIGNNGQNVFLANDGSGNFADETGARLPRAADITQDVELGDCDGDGDLDLLLGNEDANRLLLNDGAGRFAEAGAARLPLRSEVEETREAEFGDADGDGDLDIVFANVGFFQNGALVANRLLVNDGACAFTDETDTRLPAHGDHTVDAEFVDLDGDGDLDLVMATTGPLPLNRPRPARAYLNDGAGRFTDATRSVLPPTASVIGFDVEAADFDGDGRLDLYFASRYGADRLLLGRPR
jgi:hypothetical protein